VRYVITGEWKRNNLLRLILFFFLVYMLLFWVTNWLLYFQKMTLDPASVVSYFNGDPDAEFGRPPRPMGSLAEVSHFHLFAMGMLVMTLTHLLLFLPVSFRVKAGLTLVTFLSALLNQGSNWLVRFVDPVFAWVKVASFLTLQTALFGLIAALLIGVLRPARNGYTDQDNRVKSAANGRSST
jgi:hypothetical protein